MIIGAFAAMGKTTTAKKYNNIIDLESNDFKYIFTKEQLALDDEARKSTGVTLNPNYPKNYIDEILKVENDNNIVFISNQSFTPEMMLPLIKAGRKVLNIYPSPKFKNYYIQKFIDRGNNNQFIEKVKNNFEKDIEMLKNNTITDKYMSLNEKENLEDILINLGYIHPNNKINSKKRIV